MTHQEKQIIFTYKNIIGFEIFLVIFLFSYQIKNTPFFSNLPDLTTSLALLLLPWGLWLIKKSTPLKALYQNKVLFCLCLFWIWIAASFYWGPQTFHSQSKFIVHSFFTMPVVFYANLFIASSSHRLKRLFLAFILFSIPVLFEILHICLTQTHLYAGSFIFGANYLTTGQTLGVALMVVYPYTIQSSATHNTQLLFLYSGIIGLLFFTLLHTGGRGPFIALIISISCLTFLYKDHTLSLARRLLPIGLITLFTYAYHILFRLMGSTKESATLERIATIYNKGTHLIDDSINLRFDYYNTAWQAFQDNLLMGLGIGGGPIYTGKMAEYLHPHNIFLEISSELGLIGLALFSSACLCLIPKLWKIITNTHSDRHDYILLGCLIFSGLNALKSGDLNDNILLFFIIALISGKKEAA